MPEMTDTNVVNPDSTVPENQILSELDFSDNEMLDEINQSIMNWIRCHNTNLYNFHQDKYFVYIDQWSAAQRDQMNRLHKPILQENMLYDYVNKIVGQQRENTGELTVKSLIGQVSEDDIKLNEDFLRQICFNSKSRVAYQTAFADMVSGSFGAFRIVTDYEHPDSMNQIPKIVPIKDPEKTFYDCYAHDPTKCDGNYAGYFVTMSRKEFMKAHPEIPYPQSFPVKPEIEAFNWGFRDYITIVEYYKKEWYDYKMHRLNDGRMVKDEEWKQIKDHINEIRGFIIDELGNEIEDMSVLGAPFIEETITKKDCKIMMYKAIYGKIIEKKEFPGNQLPIIFAPGPSMLIDGEERLMSFVRFALDAQRFHNFVLVETAYAIQTSRREQFMGTPDNIAGHEEVWRNIANVQGLLPAKPDPVTQQLPIKLSPSEIPSTLMALLPQSAQTIQNILGYYEANRGKDSYEKSGIAIERQQSAGGMSVATFYDNLNRAIEQAGRVIMAIKPHLYDIERVIPLIDSSGKSYQKKINENMPGGIKNDMRFNKYDVILEAGPSSEIQKEKSFELMTDLCKIIPDFAPRVADKLVSLTNFDCTPTLIERAKTLVPPEILAKEEGKPPPPPQPNPQLMFAQKQIDLKEKELEIQLEKMRLENNKLHFQIEKMRSETQNTVIKAEAEVRKAALDHNSRMVDSTAKIISSHNDIRKEHHKHLYNSKR